MLVGKLETTGDRQKGSAFLNLIPRGSVLTLYRGAQHPWGKATLEYLTEMKSGPYKGVT